MEESFFVKFRAKRGIRLKCS